MVFHKKWAKVPKFLKRFWSALVKFGSPKLSVAAIRLEKLRIPHLDAEFESYESLKHANSCAS